MEVSEKIILLIITLSFIVNCLLIYVIYLLINENIFLQKKPLNEFSGKYKYIYKK